MALVPRSVFRDRDWWDDIDRWHREVDSQVRQLSLRHNRAFDDLWTPLPSFRNRFRPWREIFDNLDLQVGGGATIEQDENKYKIIVDVQQFTPSEITVRTDDRCITIEGKHDQRKDKHGYISRQFVRRYLLPRNYDIVNVQPSLSSDGILTITAPRQPPPLPRERVLPITRTWRPAIKAA